MPGRDAPALSDILCESCGYTLNGLQDGGNCPECGEPVAQSTTEARRGPSDYEIEPSFGSFWRTTGRCLAHPRRFYRSLSTRAGDPLSGRFAFIHRLLVAVMLTGVLFAHLRVTGTLAGVRIGAGGGSGEWPITEAVASVVCGLLIAGPALAGLSRLAAWLSSIEAGFWGMRLPLPVVRRAMDYHTAAYLPVAIGALAIVWGYSALVALDAVTLFTLPTYLYVIAGYVVVAAAYLFRMFVIAMMNVRYANQ